jgi:hypothetical protein
MTNEAPSNRGKRRDAFTRNNQIFVARALVSRNLKADPTDT